MNTALRHREPIVPRENIDFRLDDTIPRYWLHGDCYKTRFLDALHALFPEGERYFITSVRAFRDRISDPALLEEIAGFIRQEAQHGIVHTRCNELLDRQGLPMPQLLEPEISKINEYTRRYTPEFNVALTAALEHFTAGLAFSYFVTARVLENADPRMKAMMAWHAMEEMEHRWVAFDVMQNVARVGYFLRAWAMIYATRDMLKYAYRITDRLLKTEGYSRGQRLRMHVRNLGWLLHPRKGVYGSLTGTLLLYFKPGFHPNQVPFPAGYRRWRDAYERTGDPAIACAALCAQSQAAPPRDGPANRQRSPSTERG